MRQTAPVQGSRLAERLRLPNGAVPWAVHALAAREYNRHHSQTPERLAERGGFDWCELIAALRGDYSEAGCRTAANELSEIEGKREQ